MFGFLRRLGRGGGEPPRPPSVVDDPLPVHLERLLDRYVAEAVEIERRERLFNFTDAGLCPVTAEIDALPREVHCRLVLGAALRRRRQDDRYGYSHLGALQSRLMRRELPFTEEQLAGLLGEFPQYLAREHCPERALARAVERHVQRHGLTPSLQSALEAAVARVRAPSYSGRNSQVMASTWQMVERLQAIAVQGAALNEPGPDAGERDADDIVSAPWAGAALEPSKAGGRRSSREIDTDDPEWTRTLLDRFLDDSHRAVEDLAAEARPEFIEYRAARNPHVEVLRSLTVSRNWDPADMPSFAVMTELSGGRRADLLVEVRERRLQLGVDDIVEDRGDETNDDSDAPDGGAGDQADDAVVEERGPDAERAQREDMMLAKLADRLLEEPAAWTAPALAQLLDAARASRYPLSVRRVLGQVDAHAARHGVEPEVRQALTALLEELNPESVHDHDRDTPLPRILWLLAGRLSDADRKTFEAPPRAVALLAEDTGDEEAWHHFLALFEPTRRDKLRPTKRWLARIDAAIEDIGRERFAARLAEILNSWADGEEPPGLADLDFKQLVWSAGLVDDPALSRALGAAVSYSYRKYGGSFAVPLLDALTRHGTMDALGVLARLRRAHRKPEYLNQTESTLDALVEGSGLKGQDIDEVSVPTFGLSPEGERRIQVGAFEAVLRVVDVRTLEMTWRREDGAEQKSVPAAVKADHAAELRAVRVLVRDVREELRVQRKRLEDMMAEDRQWDFAPWRERYIDHPVVGAVARGLIWRFETGGRTDTAVWCDGTPVGADDTPLDGIVDAAAVSLWHPVDAPPGEVEAWRDWLRRHDVRQPFRQAFREAYVVTPAEEETDDASFRFAGHFLREDQFAAVRRSRDWSGERIGPFDTDGLPRRGYGASGIAAAFVVYPIEGGPETVAGLSAYCTTDEVLFLRMGSESEALRSSRLRLDDVPRRVFSEAMRDVDLFVSVCSIGADPNWEDRGAPDAMRQYWSGYLDSPPLGAAKTRHAVLEEVLPRLSIGERCRLDGRHVVVRGNRSGYRINLRSAAVFTEPGNRHLCILPKEIVPRGYERLLPFEADEDPILAVILAKAFLLAADDRITDRGIKEQIDQAEHG